MKCRESFDETRFGKVSWRTELRLRDKRTFESRAWAVVFWSAVSDQRPCFFREFRFFSKLWTAVYPSNMAPIGAKLGENAFRTIPDISFFDVEIFFKTSNSRLPPEDGSDRLQTLGKRVSGDPQHFIFRRHKHFLRQTLLLQFFFRQHPPKLFQQSACFGGAVQV